MSLVINQPQEGHFKRRLVRGGPWVGVKIEYGQPYDPETGERLDRSPRWMAWTNGQESDPVETWNSSCGNPITEAEYKSLLGQLAPNDSVKLKDMPSIF